MLYFQGKESGCNMGETLVQSLGQKDLLEKEMATHSSILAWKIPWMEEAGRLCGNCVCVCVCVSILTQSCLTLCNFMDWSPPASSVCGILQAEYWSGLSFPLPGDLPDPGVKPTSHVSCIGRQILYQLCHHYKKNKYFKWKNL